MELNKKTVSFKRNKKGVPCIWERSKKFPNMTRISCVFSPNGERKESILSRIASPDALVPIQNKDLFLKIFIDAEGIGASILRFTDINPYSNKAEVELVLRKNCDSNEWLSNTEARSIEELPLKEILKVYQTIISSTNLK